VPFSSWLALAHNLRLGPEQWSSIESEKDIKVVEKELARPYVFLRLSAPNWVCGEKHSNKVHVCDLLIIWLWLLPERSGQGRK
jgi:hypothetical protein